jgi:hypothetical protein
MNPLHEKTKMARDIGTWRVGCNTQDAIAVGPVVEQDLFDEKTGSVLQPLAGQVC